MLLLRATYNFIWLHKRSEECFGALIVILKHIRWIFSKELQNTCGAKSEKRVTNKITETVFRCNEIITLNLIHNFEVLRRSLIMQVLLHFHYYSMIIFYIIGVWDCMLLQGPNLYIYVHCNRIYSKLFF